MKHDLASLPQGSLPPDCTVIGASLLSDRPINVLIGMPGMTQSFEELQALGVKRISVGGALSGAALGGFMRAAREMREQGTFTFVRDVARFRDLAASFRR